MLTDEELLLLIKKDNPAAYTQLYNKYTGILYGHALNILKNREEAKDVVQELFTAIWTKRNEIPLTSNFSGYLFNALRNRVLNIIAKKKIESTYIGSLQLFIDSCDSITDHLVRENELKILIEQEIAKLPAKMKEIFELSRKSNLSHKEIASKLQISNKTVKNQVNNSLKILRAKLGFLK